MRAPRPTLLTYNSKDDCCFEAGYALRPLVEAAAPAFRLYGKEDHLRTHVNDVPGNHNFGIDNRQAFYRFVGDHFFPGDAKFDDKEIPSEKELRTFDDLKVDLPADNATFNSLARSAMSALPRAPELPADAAAAVSWRQARLLRLREIVQPKAYRVTATAAAREEKEGLRAAFWKLRMNEDFTVPAVELAPAEPKSTALLFGESGRASLAADAARLLAAGSRVVALDPFYYGESRIASHDWLFAITAAATGDRPLGLQASQVAAAARWAAAEFKSGPVAVVAVGPRASLGALVAAGLEERAIGRLDLHRAFGSLKEIVEQGLPVDKSPELFCFGLLEAFDIRQLAALAAPRPVAFVAPGDRAKAELSPLKAYYSTLGSSFDPLGR
jgi:hypothetical protein